MPSKKKRLDTLLVESGVFDNSDTAGRAVMAGKVLVNGQKMDKPGALVAIESRIETDTPKKYVGRGGFKLEKALDHFDLNPSGMVCVDIGSSTGGFTDCLLRRGAALVHAVDVGKGQLDWKLRTDPRVQVHEGVNARYLENGQFNPIPSLAVLDVSFISLSLVLPPVFSILARPSWAIALIKPQFEAPKESLPHGGVIEDEELRLSCIEKIRVFVEQEGHSWCGNIPSPIKGKDGNQEYLALIQVRN